MKIICEVFLSKHAGSDIAQILNKSSQLIHPLLTGFEAQVEETQGPDFICQMGKGRN